MSCLARESYPVYYMHHENLIKENRALHEKISRLKEENNRLMKEIEEEKKAHKEAKEKADELERQYKKVLYEQEYLLKELKTA